MPWIRPQDQMPKDGEPVLITDNEGLQVVAWFQGGNKWHDDKWHSENYSWFTCEVAYWMSIPEPPKPIEAMEKTKMKIELTEHETQIKMKKALLDKIIVSLQESRDAWIGKEGEVARQNYKDGISSAISAIEQIRLHSEFEEVARELMKFVAERHHPHTRVILDSTNAEILEGLQSTGQVLEYVPD